MSGRLRLNSATWRARGVGGSTASSSPGSSSSLGEGAEGEGLAEAGVGQVEEDRARAGEGGSLAGEERADVDALPGHGGDRSAGGVAGVDGVVGGGATVVVRSDDALEILLVLSSPEKPVRTAKTL